MAFLARQELGRIVRVYEVVCPDDTPLGCGIFVPMKGEAGIACFKRSPELRKRSDLCEPGIYALASTRLDAMTLLFRESEALLDRLAEEP